MDLNFIILFTGLLCDNSKSPAYKARKGQSPTLSRAKYDCISHDDWLPTVIIVTWMYEDLFSFLTIALSEGSFLLRINSV